MPLVLIFERSLETGQVPKQWKEANVTAIYKRKGQRCDPGNYRPVSLTSQIYVDVNVNVNVRHIY